MADFEPGPTCLCRCGHQSQDHSRHGRGPCGAVDEPHGFLCGCAAFEHVFDGTADYAPCHVDVPLVHLPDWSLSRGDFDQIPCPKGCGGDADVSQLAVLHPGGVIKALRIWHCDRCSPASAPCDCCPHDCQPTDNEDGDR